MNGISDVMYFFTIEYLINAGTTQLKGISDAMYFYTIVYLIIAGTMFLNGISDAECRIYYRILNQCWNYVLELDIRC